MWEVPSSKKRYDSANPADMLWVMTRYLSSITKVIWGWWCEYQYNKYIFNMIDNYSFIPVAVSGCVGRGPSALLFPGPSMLMLQDFSCPADVGVGGDMPVMSMVDKTYMYIRSLKRETPLSYLQTLLTQNRLFNS
jgi:hypothetical protein